MNGKIRELAKLAGMSFVYEYDSSIVMDVEDLEKFAELIINECVQVAAMFSIDKTDIHPDIKWDDMTDSAQMITHTTCQQVASKIKDHFGVE